MDFTMDRRNFVKAASLAGAASLAAGATAAFADEAERFAGINVEADVVDRVKAAPALDFKVLYKMMNLK